MLKDVCPVPRYYTMMLESLDGIGGNLQIIISVQRDEEMITLQIGEPLPLKCLWNALILPYDCEADMETIELSKLIHLTVDFFREPFSQLINNCKN